MTELARGLERALGTHAQSTDLTVGQMALRAVLVFLLWIVVVRLADKRLYGKYSAFDVVLAVMLGAVLGRAINGGAPFWGTLVSAGVLVALHWALIAVTSKWHAFGNFVKGRPQELVVDGRLDDRALRRNLITNQDLLEMLRLHGRIEGPAQAKLAVLERNGQISAIPLERPVRVLEIKVVDGVQTIRLEV